MIGALTPPGILGVLSDDLPECVFHDFTEDVLRNVCQEVRYIQLDPPIGPPPLDLEVVKRHVLCLGAVYICLNTISGYTQAVATGAVSL